MEEKSENLVTRDYFLKPGFIYLPEKPTVISTVLGSSVSVSLFDKRLRTGGMNHFLYPFVDTQDKTTALYGNIAVSVLIRMMQENGSKRSHLEAQIFGGGLTMKRFPPVISGGIILRQPGRFLLKSELKLFQKMWAVPWAGRWCLIP